MIIVNIIDNKCEFEKVERRQRMAKCGSNRAADGIKSTILVMVLPANRGLRCYDFRVDYIPTPGSFHCGFSR